MNQSCIHLTNIYLDFIVSGPAGCCMGLGLTREHGRERPSRNMASASIVEWNNSNYHNKIYFDEFFILILTTCIWRVAVLNPDYALRILGIF